MKGFANIYNPPLCAKLVEMLVVPVEFPNKRDYCLTSFTNIALPQVCVSYYFIINLLNGIITERLSYVESKTYSRYWNYSSSHVP